MTVRPTRYSCLVFFYYLIKKYNAVTKVTASPQLRYLESCLFRKEEEVINFLIRRYGSFDSVQKGKGAWLMETSKDGQLHLFVVFHPSVLSHQRLAHEAKVNANLPSVDKL